MANSVLSTCTFPTRGGCLIEKTRYSLSPSFISLTERLRPMRFWFMGTLWTAPCHHPPHKPNDLGGYGMSMHIKLSLLTCRLLSIGAKTLQGGVLHRAQQQSKRIVALSVTTKQYAHKKRAQTQTYKCK